MIKKFNDKNKKLNESTNKKKQVKDPIAQSILGGIGSNFKINPNKNGNHHGIKPIHRIHPGDNPHNNGPHFQTPNSDI